MPPRRSKPRPAVGSLDAGLRLLSRRAHSRAELERKLARRGYDQVEVATALRRLVELGYVDDASFAEGHVRRRSTSRGPLALSAELAARGVDRSTAGAALERFDAGAQLAAATSLAERLSARGGAAGFRELLDSVGAKLVRRGFSPGIARAACAAIWPGAKGSLEA